MMFLYHRAEIHLINQNTGDGAVLLELAPFNPCGLYETDVHILPVPRQQRQ